MTDHIPADLDKVITSLYTVVYPCRDAVIISVVDDRGVAFASSLVDDMIDDGIIAVVGNTVHPCLVPVKPCITCKWQPGIFPVSHLAWYMGIGSIPQHFYEYREALFS